MSKPSNLNWRSQVEDDVDDLDDVLTDFRQPAPSTPGPSKAPAARAADPLVPPNTAAKPGAGILDADFGNDFARELADGMAQLMRDIAAESVRGEGGGGAEGAPATEDERKREAAFRKAWEEMLVEGMNGALEKDGALQMGDPSAEGSAKGDEADPFQSSIRKAMEKLKVAEEAKDETSLADDNDTDPLAKLLSHIGEGGAESEEELQGLLESMMTQLMGKDVLYEPLKELHDKFPAYLKDNAATLKEEDKTRYAAQQKIVAEIIEVFEDPSYTPDNAEQGVKVVTLMNNMQGYGSPPSEIMGPLPPGLDLGPDGLPKLPEGCCIQ